MPCPPPGAALAAAMTLCLAGGTSAEGIVPVPLDDDRAPGSVETAHVPASRLLFSSGFEAGTTLSPVEAPHCWPLGCWQRIEGTDSVTRKYTTGATWPPNVWHGDARFQLIAGVPVTAETIGTYMFNEIRITTARDGRHTRALYSEISRGPHGLNPIGTAATQSSFQLLPVAERGDLYLSFWIRFQPDMLQQMSNLPPGPGVKYGGTWRAFFEWKTGSPGKDDGDYRVAAYVLTNGTGGAHWAVEGDNVAGGRDPLTNAWRVENRSGPAVPAGKWFKFEAFWHRSERWDGRVWMAVDGQVIADRRGANTGARRLGINRIFWNLYSGGRLPIFQWIDDLQIWNGFPASASRHPWYDPPYAAH